jgi:hypothetical protein
VRFRLFELLVGEVVAVDSLGGSPSVVDQATLEVGAAKMDREQAGFDR